MKFFRCASLFAACIAWAVLSSAQTTPPKIYLTRAFSGGCLFSDAQKPHASPLLAAIIPSLVNVSLDRLAAAFSKAGEAKTIAKTAGVNAELSSTSTPACIQLVSGSFYAGEAKVTKDALPAQTPKPDIVVHELNERGILLAERPSFLYEGRLKMSTDRSAVAIETTAFYYRERYDGSVLGKLSSARDLVVSAVIAEPGSDGNKGSGTVASFAFEKLVPLDTLYLFPGDSPPAMLWLPFKAPETAAPRVILMTVSEARDANQFLTFVGDVLKGSKDQLQIEAEQLLIPVKKKEADLKQQQAEQAAQIQATENLTAAKAAEVTARDAVDDFHAFKTANPTDSRGLRTSAGRALPLVLTANSTAGVAGIPLPFSNLIVSELNAAIRGAQ